MSYYHFIIPAADWQAAVCEEDYVVEGEEGEAPIHIE